MLNFPDKYNNKIVNINPILKKNFYNIRKFLNSDFKDKLKILVIGGSQGANFFDKTIFRALKNMPKKVKIKGLDLLYSFIAPCMSREWRCSAGRTASVTRDMSRCHAQLDSQEGHLGYVQNYRDRRNFAR